MGRRTILLAASILIAAVGVGLIALYVRGADQRATTAAAARYGPPPTTPPPAPSPTPSAGHHQDINHLGLSIEVDDPDRIWALLAPGDAVAVFAITTKTGRGVEMIDSIRVIAVGPRRAVHSTVDDATIPGTIVTLDATSAQTVELLEAQTRGPLTLAVVGTDPNGANS